MAEHKKHIDDLYREGLKDYQEAPRELVWSKIEANLDKINQKPKGGAYGKRLWYLLGALLFISASYVSFYQVKKHLGKHTPTTATIKERNTNSISASNAHPIAAQQNAANTSAPSADHNKFNGLSEKGNLQSATSDRSTLHRHDVISNSITHADSRNASSVAISSSRTINNDQNVMQPHSHIYPDQSSTVANKINNVKEEKEVTQVSLSHKAEPIAIAAKDNENARVKNTGAIPPKTASAQAAQSEPAAHSVTPADINNATRKMADRVAPHDNSSSTQQSIREKELVTLLPKTSRNQKIQDPSYVATTPKLIDNKDLLPDDNTKEVEKQDAKRPGKEATATTASGAMGTNSDEPLASHAPAKEQKTITGINTFAGNNKSGHNDVAAKENALAKDNVAPEPEAKADKDATPAKEVTSGTASNSNAGGETSGRPHKKINLAISGGVKLGYEKGFAKYAANKVTGAAYIEVAPSNKISVIAQPGIQYNSLSTTVTSGTNYYVNNVAKHFDSTVASTGGVYRYKYYQTFDSITVTRKNTISSYVGFDMPVMFKYRVSQNISVLGGLNIEMSRLFNIDNVVSVQHITGSKFDAPEIPMSPVRFHQFYDSLSFSHTSPYYTPTPVASVPNPVRVGYMLGIDYELKNKLFLELMISQILSDQGYIPDKNERSIYTIPYFRLSLGYKLFGK